MTVRLPKNFSNTLSYKSGTIKSGASVLEAELLGEQAYSLGLAEQRMKKSLEALKNMSGPKARDPKALQDAADFVHAYFIQREIIGFQNHDQPIAFYEIPKSVMALVGVKK